jgi:hypothetical protein
MRRAASWIGGLMGCVALTGAATADDVKDGTVRLPTAAVRGGPSEIFPITGSLRQGQAVRIRGEESGVCAIIPPAGSSSWIEDHAVKPDWAAGARRPDKAVVLLDNVPIRLGSDKSPSPLSYETFKLNREPVRLSRGTIVRIIGDKAFAEGKEWWRIQPPPDEVRYVAKDSLNQQTSTVVASSPAGTGAPLQPALTTQTTNPLWAQAQAAEQAHDYAKAELLYKQLAGEMAQPNGDHDLAIRCYNRIEQLSRGQTTNWPARQQAPGILVSGRPVSPAPPPTTPATGSISTGPGWLRRTGILIDGKTAYVLEDNRGQVRYYLLPLSGQSLETYVNRAIDVTGPFVRRSDFGGGGYIAVNYVQQLR